MIKRLTFVRRGDAVAPADFAERWRLAALAADGPRPTRLVHCIVRPGRADRPYHGVAIEWFDDAATLADHDRATATTTATLVDMASALRVGVEARPVFGADDLDRWWTTDETRFVVVAAIQKSPALSREQFAAYWWDVHRPLANRLLPPALQPDAYVHNYVRPGETAPMDGVGEFYEPSIERTRERTRWAERPDKPETDELIADEDRFLIRHSRWALLTDATVVIPASGASTVSP